VSGVRLEDIGWALIWLPIAVAAIFGSGMVVLGSTMAWIHLLSPSRRANLDGMGVFGACIAAAFLPFYLGGALILIGTYWR
jgi:hypothetical protein